MKRRSETLGLTRWCWAGLAWAMLSQGGALGVDPPAQEARDAVTELALEAPPPLDDAWKPLAVGEQRRGVWIEPVKKQVAVDGQVCLTKGFLEMFACLENTKEHEAVVALKTKAFAVHAALLAVGAKPGAPAVWQPTYRPAHGTTIEVWVEWVKDGKTQRRKAQDWVRDLKTKQPMTHEWVFGGSSFWKDPETSKSYYRAEGGDLICVSNFPTATLDLPIRSSQANEELAFEAFTEHIPRRKTPVRVYLIPRLQEPAAKEAGERPSAATESLPK